MAALQVRGKRARGRNTWVRTHPLLAADELLRPADCQVGCATASAVCDSQPPRRVQSPPQGKQHSGAARARHVNSHVVGCIRAASRCAMPFRAAAAPSRRDAPAPCVGGQARVPLVRRVDQWPAISSGGLATVPPAGLTTGTPCGARVDHAQLERQGWCQHRFLWSDP